MKRLSFLFICLSIAITSQAGIITVDDDDDDDGAADFNNIQAAIDDANDGDVIIVKPGTYTGYGNRDIDFKGNAITVRSTDPNDPNVVASTIIDCNGTQAAPHRGFYFHSGEDSNSVLAGLTITMGCDWGGGIKCQGSSPTITRCVITNNVSPWDCSYGEGICLGTNGGGIAGSYGSPTISNCIISNNCATGGGGGIDWYKGSPTINNCTISDNSAHAGGGIHCSASIMTVSNCTFWGNIVDYKGPQIYLHGVVGIYCPTITISYSDVQGGEGQIYISGCGTVNWGSGNIDKDPCFADPCNSDYHLESQAGRWDASEGRWTKDDVTSPCIDAGDPAGPIGPEPFPNGGIINMGAYGGTAEASKSYFGEPVCETIMAGDINGDCIVNLKDFAFMALHWLKNNNQ